jgi:hypothetical protein
MYPRASSGTSVEIKAFLVRYCGTRPHDQPEDTALHGETDGAHPVHHAALLAAPALVVEVILESARATLS